MAMSGLDIFKLLPKTNCGECGVPTCMAFAMKLAQKKSELKDCPYASENAKEKLGASSEPPIRLIKIGGSKHLEIGNETVMFRHEKTFFHPTGIAIRIDTSDGEKVISSRLNEIENFKIERVGETLKPDLFFITHHSNDNDILVNIIKLIKQNTSKGVVLDCSNIEALKQSLEVLKDDRPAIFLEKEPAEADILLAKTYNACLIISANSYNDLISSIEKTKSLGFNDIIINLTGNGIREEYQNNIVLRRSALKKNFKPFGFPIFTFIKEENEFELLAKAAIFLCKYSSILVLPKFDKALLYALLTLKQNIYTDPQKPIQVEPKIYPIGEPTEDSPIFVTTNFSLTYFIVSGEIENSSISANLIVCETEGQSVLTAWAAGKFTGEKVAKFVKESNLEQKVKTRKIVIPGFAAQISGDLEKYLPGWEVIVGCQEAADLPSFIKNTRLT